MPDLSEAASTTWLQSWRQTSSADWPPAIRPIETEAAFPAALAQLGTELDAAASQDKERLALALLVRPLQADLAEIMAQFGAARAFRILHWLAEQDLPDCHAITAGLLHDGHPGSRALRATIQAVLRRATLERMFSLPRIAALQTACEQAQPETA